MRLLASSNQFLYIACGQHVQAVPLHPTPLIASTEASNAHGSKPVDMHLLTCHGSVEKNAKVLTMAVSKCQTLLLAGYDDKSIVSWDITGINGDAVGFFKIRKKPQNITTTSYTATSATGAAGTATLRTVVLISDKFGEVHALNMALTKAEMITGHSTSVITDMVCCHSEDITSPTTTSSSSSSSSSSSTDNLLITCDRDEKIRISHFPAAHMIHSYCLHHNHVVSSMDIAYIRNRPYLFTCAWDCQMCVWDPAGGTLLTSLNVREHAGAGADGEGEGGEEEGEEGEEGEEEEKPVSQPQKKQKPAPGGAAAAVSAAVASSSSSSVAAGAGAVLPQPLEEGEGEGEGEGDPDLAKNYDDSQAGTFPTRLCHFKADDRDYLAVTFRSVGRVNIYKVAIVTSDNAKKNEEAAAATAPAASGAAVLELVAGFELSDEPCDMCIARTSPSTANGGNKAQAHIFLCLPGPVFFNELIFDSKTNEISQAVVAASSNAATKTGGEKTHALVTHAHVAKLLEHCVSNNLSFTPAYAGSEESARHAHGAGMSRICVRH